MKSFSRALSVLCLLLCFQVGAQQTRSAPSTTAPPPIYHRAVIRPLPPPQPVGPVQLSNDRHYTNSKGAVVHSPARASSVPPGAAAQCRDGPTASVNIIREPVLVTVASGDGCKSARYGASFRLITLIQAYSFSG